MITAALSKLKAVALITSTAIAGAAGVPAVHALPQPPTPNHTHTRHLSTEQMYRNYMQSGSIFYGPDASGPPAHIVSVTKGPMLQGIEHEARRFAGLPRQS